jgi:hypothetical protein
MQSKEASFMVQFCFALRYTNGNPGIMYQEVGKLL